MQLFNDPEIMNSQYGAVAGDVASGSRDNIEDASNKRLLAYNPPLDLSALLGVDDDQPPMHSVSPFHSE